MDDRDELEFGGLGCLYAVWFWFPLALLAVGFWVVRADWTAATPLGGVLIGAGVAWLALEFGVRRRLGRRRER